MTPDWRSQFGGDPPPLPDDPDAADLHAPLDLTPDALDLPIEQVRAELKAAGIDCSAATNRVLDAVRVARAADSAYLTSLRDRFAMAALTGLLASRVSDQDGAMPLVYWSDAGLAWNHRGIPGMLAARAYEVADAVMARRLK